LTSVAESPSHPSGFAKPDAAGNTARDAQVYS